MSDDKLAKIKRNLENLEYERHGSTREDIAWLVDEVAALRAELANLHYTSTACQHDLHERCRLTCKFCGSSCRCRCGHLAATVDVPVSASDR